MSNQFLLIRLITPPILPPKPPSPACWEIRSPEYSDCRIIKTGCKGVAAVFHALLEPQVSIFSLLRRPSLPVLKIMLNAAAFDPFVQARRHGAAVGGKWVVRHKAGLHTFDAALRRQGYRGATCGDNQTQRQNQDDQGYCLHKNAAGKKARDRILCLFRSKRIVAV